MKKIAKKPVDTRIERENQILNAALNAFKTKGFKATRMDDVAKIVGLSKPAIYIYFKNKEELFKGVAQRVALEILPQLGDVTSTPDIDSSEKLRRLMAVIYHEMIICQRASILPIIAEVAGTFPEVARFFRDELRTKMEGTILQVITNGVAAGEFRETKLSEYGELIIGPILALGLRQVMWNAMKEVDTLDIDAFRDAHIEMLLTMLKK